jgi:hypothetical protein
MRDVDMLQPVIEALKAHRAQQAAMRLKRGEGEPEAGKDNVFTGSEGGFLNLNYIREKIWYANLAAAPTEDRPTSLSWPLVRPTLNFRERRRPAHTSDTTSTSRL